MNRFRLLLFVPNPFNGMSWPLGAVIEVDGEVQVARSGRLPDGVALGSELTAALARRLHRRLDEFRRFDQVPISFGPYAILADAHPLPIGVADPVRWVEAHILPQAAPNETNPAAAA